jgi:hypothetical protein
VILEYQKLYETFQLATNLISVTQPLLENWSPTLAGGLRPVGNFGSYGNLGNYGTIKRDE